MKSGLSFFFCVCALGMTCPKQVRATVNIMTGQFSLAEQDYTFPGSQLSLRRLYGIEYTSPGFFGPLWCSNLDYKLRPNKRSHYVSQCGKKIKTQKVQAQKNSKGQITSWQAQLPSGVSLRFNAKGDLTQYSRRGRSIEVTRMSSPNSSIKRSVSLKKKGSVITNRDFTLKKPTTLSIASGSQRVIAQLSPQGRITKLAHQKTLRRFRYKKGHLTEVMTPALKIAQYNYTPLVSHPSAPLSGVKRSPQSLRTGLARSTGKASRTRTSAPRPMALSRVKTDKASITLDYKNTLVSQITKNGCQENFDYDLHSPGKILVNTKKSCHGRKPNGNRFLFVYNKRTRGLETFVEDDAHRTVQFSPSQKIESVNDPRGQFYYYYNKKNQVYRVKKTAGSEPYTASIGYTESGRIHRIHYQYDGGRKSTTRLTYSPQGHLQRLRQGQSRPTVFSYNGKGQLKSMHRGKEKIQMEYTSSGALRGIASLSSNRRQQPFSSKSERINGSAKAAMRLYTRAYAQLGPLFRDTTLLTGVLP